MCLVSPQETPANVLSRQADVERRIRCWMWGWVCCQVGAAGSRPHKLGRVISSSFFHPRRSENTPLAITARDSHSLTRAAVDHPAPHTARGLLRCSARVPRIDRSFGIVYKQRKKNWKSRKPFSPTWDSLSNPVFYF